LIHGRNQQTARAAPLLGFPTLIVRRSGLATQIRRSAPPIPRSG